MNHYLYFENIKEHRGAFFVEYRPPIADNPFATLYLTFPDPVAWECVSKHLNEEIRYWMGRYRVPLMAGAWNCKEDLIHPPDRSGNFLVAWTDPASGEIVQSWHLDDLNAFLKLAPPHPDWRTIYTDVAVRTDAELKAAARERAVERARQIRGLKIILMLWLAVIPAGYAVFEYLGPEWVGGIGLAFAIWNALKTASQIWGRAKPTAQEEEASKRHMKMKHYFYHCELNPDGFQRLKIKNFEDDARERVQQEAERLADGRDKLGDDRMLG